METKICTICNRSKPLDEFSWKNKAKGIKEGRCKDCKREYVKAHYRKNAELYKKRARAYTSGQRDRNAQLMVEYLHQHPCVDCGESDVVVLEFDHLEDKDYAVTVMVNHGYAWETIMGEIAKCEVRCSNCHKRRTAKTRGWKWKT